jgi:hypothetical protein
MVADARFARKEKKMAVTLIDGHEEFLAYINFCSNEYRFVLCCTLASTRKRKKNIQEGKHFFLVSWCSAYLANLLQSTRELVLLRWSWGICINLGA